MSVIDATRRTFEQFAIELFEFEHCSECHGDAKDHEPWAVLGHWFAHCKADHVSPCPLGDDCDRDET